MTDKIKCCRNCYTAHFEFDAMIAAFNYILDLTVSALCDTFIPDRLTGQHNADYIN